MDTRGLKRYNNYFCSTVHIDQELSLLRETDSVKLVNNWLSLRDKKRAEA